MAKIIIIRFFCFILNRAETFNKAKIIRLTQSVAENRREPALGAGKKGKHLNPRHSKGSASVAYDLTPGRKGTP